MSQKLTLCLIMLFSFVVENNSISTPPDESTFMKTISNMLTHGVKKNWFTKLLSEFDLFNVFRYLQVPPISKTICFTCRAVMSAIIDLVRTNRASEKAIIDKLTAICVVSRIQKKDVCEGVIKLNTPYLYYIVKNNGNLEAKVICGQLLQFLKCASSPPVWSLKIHEPQEFDKLKGEYIGRTLKILQLTDIHYDSLYKPGSLANCGKPMCCQRDSGKVTNPKDKAGLWTDYRLCDVSLPLLRNTLQHITTAHPDIDYVYSTGDIISHRVWDTSKHANLRDIRVITELIRQHFKVPIFSIIGNHEPHPLNVFTALDVAKEEFSTNWLFKELDKLWRKSMPNFKGDSILRGGYYSYLVRPGFRIVAINSNTAYIFNWWLMTDQIDIYRQLEWLNDVLYEAEGNGEYVHILSHVPSSDSTCHKIWSREFRRVVERYYHIIAGIFNGHTHYDEFIVYHSKNNPMKPIAVAWNGGSLTPYVNRNPNYRIYTIDAYNYDVLDYEDYIFNVTEANLSKKPPRWYKSYSFKEEYRLDDLSPSSVQDLIWKMAQDKCWADLYIKHRLKDSDKPLTCDIECKREVICQTVRSEINDSRRQCDILYMTW